MALLAFDVGPGTWLHERVGWQEGPELGWQEGPEHLRHIHVSPSRALAPLQRPRTLHGLVAMR
eukprot:5603627-Amphidinium_carterae.2